jgi:DNA polymerase III epsilon subunit-like protein
MKVLLFDTETNGLPKAWRASPYDTGNWPVILTLAWQRWVVDPEGRATFEANGSYLFCPPTSMVWDSEAEKIHNISRVHAETHGRPSSEILPEFINVVRGVDLIVAHNMQFDKTVLLCESIRINPTLRMDWWPRFEYCTCENTKTLCALPPATTKPVNPKDPYKKPKLVELYRCLFPDRAADFPFHSAEGDTECLTQCFLELARRRVVPLELWERSMDRA